MHTLQRALAGVRSATHDPQRRAFLARGVAAGAALTLPRAFAQTPHASAAARIVVIGGGLAGLAALDTLERAGLRAQLFEAAPRVGGRCWSERRAFGAQVAERGGEFIDTGHEAILALAKELALELDDVLEAEAPGTAPLWWFDGAPYTLADATADLQRLLPALDADAGILGETLPTYARATVRQRELDRMSAATWIERRVPGGARSRLGRLLANAYTEELGGDPHEISAVTVVALLRATPRDSVSPYADSDQRFHVRGGNERIVEALASRVADRIDTGMRMTALARDPNGGYRIAFARDTATRVVRADRVILALPFTLLRDVDLAHAGFRARKLGAIRTLGMGRNTKLQLGFTSRHWRTHGCNGETRLTGSYVTSWEVTRAQPGDTGILNFFSGGTIAQRAGTGTTEDAARAALADLEQLHPGSTAQWTGSVIRNAWDRHPWTRGSYALLKPGQYAAFHGAEWEPEGRVYFAGEHTSEEWSGFLNGAVESGQRAAREVIASLAARRRAA